MPGNNCILEVRKVRRRIHPCRCDVREAAVAGAVPAVYYMAPDWSAVICMIYVQHCSSRRRADLVWSSGVDREINRSVSTSSRLLTRRRTESSRRIRQSPRSSRTL